jgi:biotin carboxyl carrier protein
MVTLEPLGGESTSPSGGAAPTTAVAAAPSPAPAAPAAAVGGTDVFSTFAGAVEVVDVKVRVGDQVEEGGVIAVVEAMKATHDIRTPTAGKVTAVHVKPGDEIDSTTPVVTLG